MLYYKNLLLHLFVVTTPPPSTLHEFVTTQPKPPINQQNSDNNDNNVCDVAVIGSGFAGLSAAIEASNALQDNNKIWVLEKMPVPGGNSVMNAGQIACAGSDAQQKAGIEDSVELMMQDMRAAGVDLNHPELLREMIQESNDIVKWTQDVLGIQYRDRVTQMGGHSVPRTLSTLNACGNDIVHPMLKHLKGKSNVKLCLNTAFQGFCLDPNDCNRVTGVKVRDTRTNEERTVECTRGVVVASGGFSADVPFRVIQNPAFHEKVDTTNQRGATAEVLKEMLRIGAMPVQLSRIQLGPWTSPDEHGFGKAPFFCAGAAFPYGIIVDPDTSKRFANELNNRHERSKAILNLGHPAVCLVDSVGAEHSLQKPLDKLKPAVKRFDTLEELGEAYGMDATVLAETVQSYNQGVAKGQDEFGKPFRDDLQPMETAPFYSCRLWPKVHHTMGGIRINTNAQVLNLDGKPIEGLYAAGEVVGGIHGGDRLGSCATLDCLAFGRKAGAQVAALTPQYCPPTTTTRIS